MKLNKILSVLFSLTIIASSVGCSGNPKKEINRWEIDKESFGDAKELIFSTKTEGDTKTYLVSNYEPLVTGELTSEDILFFDFGKAYKIMSQEDYEFEYLTYETMKETAIEFNSVTTSKDLSQFTITAPKGSSNKACILVNKDKTASGEFIFASIGESLTADAKTPQEEFEEKYGRASKGGTVAKTVSSFVTGFVTAVIGGIAKEPGLLATGIVNIINGAVGLFSGLTEPTIRDVLEKLAVIETRLIAIENKMNKNFSDIRKDSKFTQAKIDKAISEIAQQNIDAFERKELFNLEAYSNVMSNNIKADIKNIVAKGNLELNIPYYYNEDKVLCYRPLTEVAANPNDNKVSVTIGAFPKTKEALVKSQNIFDADVYKIFSAETLAALDDVVLPAQMTKELLNDFVFVRMVDEIVCKYYSTKKTEGVKYMNSVLAFAKCINGTSGYSIINSYRTRLEYMYNFAKEAKPSFNTVVARLRYTLEQQYANCMIACIWCGTDYSTLTTAYESALSVLIDTAKEIDKLSDNYSYIVGENVSANLYSSYTFSHFKTGGNYPTHYSEFALYRYHSVNRKDYLDAEKYITQQQIDYESHYAMILRMNYLVSANALKSSITYYDYLIKSGILEAETTKCIKDFMDRGEIKNDPYHFITNIEHRQLTDSDKGKYKCHMTDCGLERMKYFDLHETYDFKSKHGSEYWHGSIWESITIDPFKNSVSTEKMLLGLEGCYDEGHDYWITDERWRFNGGLRDTYFLAMAKEI